MRDHKDVWDEAFEQALEDGYSKAEAYAYADHVMRGWLGNRIDAAKIRECS